MIETKYKEKYRPQFHFTPAANWMNDPNGMVYYEGEYHLFYQYHPHGTTWGPMHWGHAVSPDLVHWEHLPVALEPDHNGYIFSGSAVVDYNDTTGFFSGGSGLVAVYTHADTYLGTDVPRQRQSIAYSLDKGRTWNTYEGNPVLTEEQLVDFRDPKVFWHSESNRWIMVVAAGDHVRIYASLNLKQWSLTGQFGARDGSHDGVWECPDLFELPVDDMETNKKWILIVSIGDRPEHPEGSRTQYFVGEFDGYAFSNDNAPETVLWVDHGRDNYAGVTWSDIPNADGRRLCLGWMSNWKYANLTPTLAWRSAMTIPRVLSLHRDGEDIRLSQQPVNELQSLRLDSQCWEDIQILPEHNLLAGLEGHQLEITAEFEIGRAQQFGFKLRTSDREETVVGYDAVARTLFIDRTHSGEINFQPQFACKHAASLQPVNGRIQMHIFVDWSSVEVFANNGKLVMTDLIFPDPDSKGIQIFAAGGAVMLHSMTIHTLKTIYESSVLHTSLR